MHYTFFIIILLINLLIIKSSKTISLKYKEIRSMRPVLELEFSNASSPLDTYLNTFLPFSLFDNDLYSRIKVDKESEHTCPIKKFSSAFKHQETLLINNTTLFNFTFYLYKYTISLFAEQGIGLGYNAKDQSLSFVHQMYNNKLIDALSFSIERKEIVFGKTEYNQYKYKGSINIDENIVTWGMKLDSIEYNGKRYDIGIDAIIHSGEYEMIYSNEIFDFMSNIVLKEEINKGICTKSERLKNYMLNCDNYTNFDKSISLVLGETTITFELKNLFDIDNALKIYPSTDSPSNFPGIILGVNFLKSFDAVIFSYDTKSITFYSNEVKIESMRDEIVKKIIISIITVISIIGIIIIKINNKKV